MSNNLKLESQSIKKRTDFIFCENSTNIVYLNNYNNVINKQIIAKTFFARHDVFSFQFMVENMHYLSIHTTQYHYQYHHHSDHLN